MQRGVLTLSKEEFLEMINALNLERFMGTHLYEKLNGAKEGTGESIQILLSEDEIEKILDEIGSPITDSLKLNSALEKMKELFTTFRS